MEVAAARAPGPFFFFLFLVLPFPPAAAPRCLPARGAFVTWRSAAAPSSPVRASANGSTPGGRAAQSARGSSLSPLL